jgi:hypothetical protein
MENGDELMPIDEQMYEALDMVRRAKEQGMPIYIIVGTEDEDGERSLSTASHTGDRLANIQMLTAALEEEADIMRTELDESE